MATTRKPTKGDEIERLSLFPKLSPNPIVEISLDGELVYANPAAKEAFPEIMVQGTAHTIFRSFFKVMEALKDGGEQFSISEIEYNGRYFEQRSFYATESNSIHIYFSDITEKKDKDKLKEDFIRTVSHELRTPLTIIHESVDMMREGLFGEINDKQMRIMTNTHESVERLARMVTELLDMSRLEAGQTRLKYDIVNVIDVAKSVENMFREKIRTKGLELSVITNTSSLELYADKDKLTQILVNLIGNSCKFTEKGKIEVAIKDKKDAIECSVADTGRGIAKEDLPRIFDKFSQFSRKHGSGEGTGLGLAIVKGFVDLHCGHLEVSSRLGKGTVISFTIPKFSYRDLVRRHVDLAIDHAAKNGSEFSIISMPISKLKGALLRKAEIFEIVNDIESEILSNLFRADDTVLKSKDEIIALLRDCGSSGIVGVKERLKSNIVNLIKEKDLKDKVHIPINHVSYPADVGRGDEVLSRLFDTTRS